MTVRCGQCIGCRLYRSFEWGVRMVHESKMYDHNCSLTLTYDDEHLPENGSLLASDHQKFIKRLRKRYGFLRFFHAGEYGENTKRPHYHTLLFGLDFLDKYHVTNSRSGLPLYASDTLNRIWGKGFAYIGTLTFASAQYAAKYTTKVLNVSKDSDEDAYRRWQSQWERVNPLTGEIISVAPEYATMSNRPGLGEPWFNKFYRDVYPSDEVVVEGKVRPPPRYYDKLLEKKDPEMYAEVKRSRLANRDRRHDSEQRLLAQETCALARNNLYGERK